MAMQCKGLARGVHRAGTWLQAIRIWLLTLAVAGLTACQTPNPLPPGMAPPGAPGPATLRQGESITVAFPGAPNLNTTQQVRADGMITLPLVGEIKVVGLTTSDVEKQLTELYAPQLVNKQVNVSVNMTVFPVFVTGAVMRPGKVMSDRPMTALEAVMEAGGFDYTRANLKSVRIIRNEEGQVKNYPVNLNSALKRQETEPFFLRPSDIVYVPEKFTWF